MEYRWSPPQGGFADSSVRSRFSCTSYFAVRFFRSHAQPTSLVWMGWWMRGTKKNGPKISYGLLMVLNTNCSFLHWVPFRKSVFCTHLIPEDESKGICHPCIIEKWDLNKMKCHIDVNVLVTLLYHNLPKGFATQLIHPWKLKPRYSKYSFIVGHFCADSWNLV